MNHIFLGKWWHWLILVVSVLLMWSAGSQKMHVIHFNAFVLLLITGTVIAVFCIVHGTQSGEQVTRDPLKDEV